MKLTQTVKFEASEKEISDVRDALNNWENNELLSTYSYLEGALCKQTSDNDIKKNRVSFLHLALIQEALLKRGYKIHFIDKKMAKGKKKGYLIQSETQPDTIILME